MFIRDDFPTFDLPMKANSGKDCAGLSDILVLLPANNASVIFINCQNLIKCVAKIVFISLK